MLLYIGDVKSLRLAQIYKVFRGTHDIFRHGRKLNLALCIVPLAQELVNRLTDYSN